MSKPSKKTEPAAAEPAAGEPAAADIVMMSPEVLKPYWRNPRNNAQSVDTVAASIAEFGFNVPIVVDAAHVIIAGHTRHKAAMKMKLKEVPVIIRAMSDAQAKKYRIVDNKAGEASTWNMDTLMIELREIGDTSDMQKYFTDMDIEAELTKSAGGAITPVTNDQVTRTEVQQHERFVGQNNKKKTCDVICPNCANEFSVQIDEFNATS